MVCLGSFTVFILAGLAAAECQTGDADGSCSSTGSGSSLIQRKIAGDATVQRDNGSTLKRLLNATPPANDAPIDDGDQNPDDHFPEEDDDEEAMLVETVDHHTAKTVHQLELNSRSNTSDPYSATCYMYWTYGGARRRGGFTFNYEFFQTDSWGSCDPYCIGERVGDPGKASLTCNGCYNYQRGLFDSVTIEFTGESWAWLDHMDCTTGSYWVTEMFGVAGGGHWKFDGTGQQYARCRRFVTGLGHGHAEAC